jgi:hypothetical protein
MSTKNAYRLINPYIEGSIDTIVRASNSFSAGKKMYNNISRFFTNHMDDFYMTIQNMESKDLTHFKIEEKRNENNTVDFSLIMLEKNFNPDFEKKIINSVEKMDKQTGGNHSHNDSTSDSTSSESDYYRTSLQPISRFVYFYLPYYKLDFVGLTATDISRIFLPMFNLPINPRLEIRFDLYKY